ncbi:hypothetical protein [Shewanella baltica]|uniref:hypothetical protein n=1 Tax=Shewanella baltica TaxID=62322 RepID=UPI000EC17501|nr:hypothetical protein [Shewanella baltica]HCE52924.1 hypothetical protein [Shewanella baltica]
MDLNLFEHAFELKDDRWIFKAGLAQYPQARQVAKLCTRFIPDDEDEQIDDEPHSCYNCQYRRWMVAGFECLALRHLLKK